MTGCFHRPRANPVSMKEFEFRSAVRARYLEEFGLNVFMEATRIRLLDNVKPSARFEPAAQSIQELCGKHLIRRD